MPNSLIVNFSFNPPEIVIIGGIRENTIEKLNTVLPAATTSTRSARAGAPKFVFDTNRNFWKVTLDGQFCDQVGESALFLSVLDALEEEGGWKLVSTQGITLENHTAIQQEFYEAYKFFFSRIL
jgi:hypothetical protein